MTPCVLALLGLSVAVAAPRRVDMGKRSDLLENTVNFDTRNPHGELDNQFQGKTMDLKEWHGNFSSLGEKKSNLQDDRSRYNRDTVEMGRFDKKTLDLQKSPDSRRMATIGNWNNLKEQVMASKFTNTELKTPEGRRFQQMVDEVSLRDINRFETQRNMTDEGIPEIKAGSGEKLQVKE